MTRCVFELCSADVAMVAERAAPGPRPEAVRRVPQHSLGGHEEIGLCPASLMLVPLSRYDQEQLDQQHAAIQRLLAAREEAARRLDPPAAGPQQPLVTEPEPYRPGRVPRPDDSPQWFKPNPGSSSRHHPPLQGFTPLHVVPESGPYPGGSPVATVAEVRATLNRALQLIAEAQGQMSTGAAGPSDKLAQALQLINFVKQTSVDPMGAPQVLAAIEKLDEAAASCRSAIEEIATYMGGNL